MKINIRIYALILIDIILLNISAVLAYLAGLNSSRSITPAELLPSLGSFLVINIIVKIICFYLFRMYTSLWRYAGINEMISVLGAVFFSNAAVLVCKYAVGSDIPGNILVIVAFADTFLVGGARFAYRVLRSIYYAEKSAFSVGRRVLIVGNKEAGAAVVKELISHPELRAKPVAIIDDDSSKWGRKICGVPITGAFNSISGVIRKKKVDEIIIVAPSINNKFIKRVYNECLKTQLKIKILPTDFPFAEDPALVRKIRDVNIYDLLGREPVKLDMSRISSYVKNMAILVTGAGGTIGS